MRIKDVKAFSAKLHKKMPLRAMGNTYDVTLDTLVKISTDEHVFGFGEARARFGETQQSMMSIMDSSIAPALIGENPFDIERILNKLDFIMGNNQRFYAKSMVDQALHDIVGKALRTPVYNLLGGCFRDELSVSYTIWMGEPKQAAEDAKKLLRQGFKVLEVKIGYRPIKEDVERVKAVREAAGPEIPIWVDANEAYKPKESIDLIRKMSKYNVGWFEQPVPWWDLKGLAKVRKAVFPEVLIIADQSCVTVQDTMRMIELESADLFNIKPSRQGILRSKTIAKLAEAAGLDVKLGTSDEGSVSHAAGLHFAASTGNLETRVCEIPLWENKNDIAKGLQSDEGGTTWKVPKTPGLGVDVDEHMLTPFVPL